MALAVPVLPPRYAGSRITAGVWKNDVTDAVNFLLNPPQFVLYASAVQSIPNNAWTSVALGASASDPYNGHSNTVNNSRWTCPAGVGGWYAICGVVAYVPNSTNFRAPRLTVNGSPVIASSIWSPPNGAGEVGVSTPTRGVYLTPGDYVELQTYQSTGGALSTYWGVEMRCGLWGVLTHV